MKMVGLVAVNVASRATMISAGTLGVGGGASGVLWATLLGMLGFCVGFAGIAWSFNAMWPGESGDGYY